MENRAMLNYNNYCIQTLPRSGYGFASATRQLSYGWKTLGVQRCLLLRQSLRTDIAMIDEGRFLISNLNDSGSKSVRKFYAPLFR